MTPQEMARIHAAAYTHSRPWSTREFADLFAHRFTHVNGDSRSFALFQVIVDEAELLTIATHPGHRRLGLARKIMADWQSEALHLGASRVILEVADDNVGAIELYNACGFKACGRRSDYYQRKNSPNVDALVMECRLNAKKMANFFNALFTYRIDV